ncbi:HMCN [Mytilus coruscus]|uniref:HMCN n=1 Tax=Mytilus coruscus TaxID=42192 RepID=A0A6J8E9J7_MYTCO|nr:HMCN [Mytilus coruscus]
MLFTREILAFEPAIICNEIQGTRYPISGRKLSIDMSSFPVALKGEVFAVLVSGDIRIKSGRLEIFYDFEWGTVYYGNFDDYTATVACRQLGYSTGISLGNIVDNGVGKIWLDDIKCTGVESKLTDCVIKKWRITSRSHSGDVGIRCSNDSRIVFGKWASWANWNDCSNGIQTRSRRCDNPPSSNGGLLCKGDTLEAKLCNTFDGSWGPWSIWNTYNVTCGGRKQWRFRHCNNPTSLSGGSDCGTDNYEINDCNTENCPGMNQE